MPFEKYPEYRGMRSDIQRKRLARPGRANHKAPEATGGGWSAFAIAGLSAIGSYFSARAQIGTQERGWQHQLELERLRIEAEKELDRERRTLDPAIYAYLKKEIMRPLAPHGAGGKAPTGTFRNLLNAEARPPVATPTPMGRGAGTDELMKYFKGG